MFFVFLVFSVVPAAVTPCVYAYAMHIVVFPLALVLATVDPCIEPRTRNLVLRPSALIFRPISPLIESIAVLHADLVMTCEDRAIIPIFLTFAVLQVVFPLATVASPIRMHVASLSISLIIDPHAVIYIAISVRENPLTVCIVVFPKPAVLRLVQPHLAALAISEATHPLTLVDCTRLIGVGWTFLTLGVRVIDPISQRFFEILLREILGTGVLRGLHLRNLIPSAMPAPQRLHLSDLVDKRRILLQRIWV